MAWMDHLNYLPLVVEEDLRCINEKEATYQGSWKKSGGRSAWFMLRRKIDRMLEMLKKPEPPHGFNLADLNDTLDRVIDPDGDASLSVVLVQHLRDVYVSEDIFLKIENDPSGDDGSVLAEVRDLRRYLTLVEAEMISRGVVANPVPSGEFRMIKEDWGKHPGTPIGSSGPIASMDIGPGTPEDGGHHARHEEPEDSPPDPRKSRTPEGDY